MNIFRKSLMNLGGILLAAMFIATLAPKAVRAVAASLVQVVNTPASPVPVKEVENLVDEPFATMICAFCSALTQSTFLPVVPPSSFVVPAVDSAGNPVKALVIKYIGTSCQDGNFALTTTVPGNSVNGITQIVNFLPLTEGFAIGGQEVSILAPPSSTVGIFLASQLTAGCLVSVNGYLAH